MLRQLNLVSDWNGRTLVATITATTGMAYYNAVCGPSGAQTSSFAPLILKVCVNRLNATAPCTDRCQNVGLFKAVGVRNLIHAVKMIGRRLWTLPVILISVFGGEYFQI